MKPMAVTVISAPPGPRRAWLALSMAAVLAGCQAMPADGAPRPAAAAPPAIHTITLERGCFGCADAGLLVLRRDGAATHTVAGNARQGIESKTVRGRISAADFNRLADTLVALGFFGLADSYEDPQIRDGAWVTLGVAGSGPDKQVFSREGAGPAALMRMASAVEAAKAQITFAP